MNPQSKAIYLVDRYLDKMPRLKSNKDFLIMSYAKECALILVNEMLNNFLSNRTTEYGRERYHFWQEVKQEIEKL